MTTMVPYDPEIEQALIGGLLTDQSVVERLVADLQPSDFYTPGLSAIFGAVVELHQSGYVIDPLTVANHLRVSGRLDGIGDPAVFVKCMTRYGGRHAVGSYVTAVRREATARAVGVMLSEARGALSEEVDPLTVVENLEARLQGLTRAGQLPERYWRSANDYMATDHTETMTPLAEGVCYPLSRIMVIASEKLGKSVMCRQLAFCFAAGIHPFNPRVRIEPVPTLLFDAENDDDELVVSMDRIRAGVEYWAGPDAAQPAVYSVPYGVDLASRRDRGDFLAVLEDFHPRLVIGGPVYKMTDQTQDLSEDRRAAIVQGVFNDVRKRFGSAVILEHHAPSGTGRGRDIRAKGGQVWPAWVNMTIALHPSNDDASAEVRYPHPPRGRFRWPKRFDRGLANTDWPWVPVMRTPVSDVQPPLTEPPLREEEDWREAPF